MTPSNEWRIARPVWWILLSWGMAVLVIAGMFAAWIRSNQRQQDQDMCTLMTVFIGGPEPVAGSEGDRGRVVLAAIREYYARRCSP